jgi:hypothetical protein
VQLEFDAPAVPRKAPKTDVAPAEEIWNVNSTLR